MIGLGHDEVLNVNMGDLRFKEEIDGTRSV
jgi:hypothetical protein